MASSASFFLVHYLDNTYLYIIHITTCCLLFRTNTAAVFILECLCHIARLWNHVFFRVVLAFLFLAWSTNNHCFHPQFVGKRHGNSHYFHLFHSTFHTLFPSYDSRSHLTLCGYRYPFPLYKKTNSPTYHRAARFDYSFLDFQNSWKPFYFILIVTGASSAAFHASREANQADAE